MSAKHDVNVFASTEVTWITYLLELLSRGYYIL